MTAYREHVADALGIPESAITVSLLSCPLDIPATILPFTFEELEKEKLITC